MLTFPGICSNDLSADCALHRAVNTSTAAPVDTLQLEFVVDAAEPETHCLSLSRFKSNEMSFFLSRLQEI